MRTHTCTIGYMTSYTPKETCRTGQSVHLPRGLRSSRVCKNTLKEKFTLAPRILLLQKLKQEGRRGCDKKQGGGGWGGQGGEGGRTLTISDMQELRRI